MSFSPNSDILSRLIQIGIVVGGLIVAMIIGQMVAKEQYSMLLMFAALAVGLVVYFGFSKYFWMICFGAIFIPGSLAFLPLGMSIFEVFLIAGVIHFAVDQIVLNKNFPRLGRKPDCLLICLLLTVVLYHAFKDRLGVRLLGSDVWGGRGYLSVLVAALAYFCIQAMKLDLKAWNRFPAVIMVVGLMDLGIKVATALSPGLAAVIGRIYTGVYSDIPGAAVARFGFLGNFGYLAIVTALCYSTIPGFIFRGKLLPPFLFLIGVLGCLTSGYRSSLVFGFTLVLMGSIRDLRGKTVVFLIAGILALSSLSLVNSGVYRLPQGIQRGLVWLPGDWDQDMVNSAAGSDEFRFKLWSYWLEYFFPQHPIIGRGMGVPSEDILKTIPTSAGVDLTTGETLTKMQDTEDGFSIAGNLHSGFLSTLDRFGIFGAVFVFSLSIFALSRFVHFLLSDPKLQKNKSLHWTAIYGSTWIICYPVGALRVEDYLPTFFILFAIFNRLTELEKAGAKKPIEIEPAVPSQPAALAFRNPAFHR